MTYKFIKSSEKKQIESELEKIYGIQKLPYLLIEAGKRKIRAFSGSLLKEEIMALSKSTKIELVGIYLISKKDEEARLNFDAVSLLKDKINKNIIEINKEHFEKWIRGQDLELKIQKGTVVIKYENDLIGIGKSNGEKVFNYMPKERKLRTQILI